MRSGDGVLDAFNFSNQVLCVDFHKFVSGFFPGTGPLQDVGKGIGKYYSMLTVTHFSRKAVNVPLKDGIDDAGYIGVFTQVMDLVKECWRPDVIVWTCGSDLLAGDPHGGFDVTLKTTCFMARYVAEVIVFVFAHCNFKMNLPTIILGGGGYHEANAARMAALVTHIFVKGFKSADLQGSNASSEIKENASGLDWASGLPLTIPPNLFQSRYASRSLVEIPRAYVKNMNDDSYLQLVVKTIQQNLKQIKSRGGEDASDASEASEGSEGSEESDGGEAESSEESGRDSKSGDENEEDSGNEREKKRRKLNVP